MLAPAFYALGDSRTPMYVSLASIATNYIVASLMIRAAGMGHAGLTLSTSAVALFWILRNRLGGIHGRALARDTARILTATAAMAGVVWLSSHAIQSWLGPRKLGYLADVAVSIPLAAVVSFLAGRWFGIGELKLVKVPGSPLF